MASLRKLSSLTNITPGTLSEQNPDITEVTTEVDENGNPIPADVQNDGKKTHDDDPWWYRLDISKLSTCELTEYTDTWKEANKIIPYCPVYVSRNQETDSMVATAYITGQVADLSEYVDLVDLLEVMKENDLLVIYIDSPGGYVATGAAIASCIDTCKGKVIGIARGLCASAGSLIWSACHICIAEPFANFMYHMSSHFDMGNSEGIRERAAIQVGYVTDCLLKVAFDKGHITKEEMRKIALGKENVFISAQEMHRRLTANSSMNNEVAR